MPYVLRKAQGKDKYWVVNAETKKKYSKDPLPIKRAEAQRRALYASERRGGADDDYDVQTPPIPLQASPYDPQIKRLLLRMRDSVSPRATTTFQAFPGLFDDDVMENDALLDRIMELFEWTDYPNGRFYVVDALDEMIRGINTARGREGRGAPTAQDQDLIKDLERRAKELMEDQKEAYKESIDLAKETKDALEVKKDLIELTDLNEIKTKTDAYNEKLKEQEKIGSGIPESQLAELLTLFSKSNKSKSKNFTKHVNQWIRKQLKGGKARPCPDGYTNNNKGLCVEDCKARTETTQGPFCRENCPDDYDTGVFECFKKYGENGKPCPEGYNDVFGLSCYKPPGGLDLNGDVKLKEVYWKDFDCTGEWYNRKCDGGFKLKPCPPGMNDWGLVCSSLSVSPLELPKTFTRDRTPRRLRTRKVESGIDFYGTIFDIEKGVQTLLEFLGPEFQAKFDPEKNGIAALFKRFNGDENKVIKFLTAALEKTLTTLFNANEIRTAFINSVGQSLKETVGNGEWWKTTMSDPRTYIFIIGTLASIAAIVLSGGLAGIGIGVAGAMSTEAAIAVVALNALGPIMNMIADAVEGKPIDVVDVIGLGLAIIPMGGNAAQAAGRVQFSREGMKAMINASGNVVAGISAKAITGAAYTLATIAVSAAKIGQKFGWFKKFTILNAHNLNESVADTSEPSACDLMLGRFKLEYQDDDWTESCPKPLCRPNDYDVGTKTCSQPPPLVETDDQEELYKRASWAWAQEFSSYMAQMPNELESEEEIQAYMRAFALQPKDFPKGFTGWTEQYPSPDCYPPNIFSEKSRKCLTEDEWLEEEFADDVENMVFGNPNANVSSDDLVIDAEAYAEANPEVKAEFSFNIMMPPDEPLFFLDEARVINHANTIGKQEGRNIPMIGREQAEERTQINNSVAEARLKASTNSKQNISLLKLMEKPLAERETMGHATQIQDASAEIQKTLNDAYESYSKFRASALSRGGFQPRAPTYFGLRGASGIVITFEGVSEKGDLFVWADPTVNTKIKEDFAKEVDSFEKIPNRTASEEQMLTTMKDYRNELEQRFNNPGPWQKLSQLRQLLKVYN